MYAVIDLETTGLDPDRHDRIVEIAVIHVTDAGDITAEWTTLINPQRDMGPQHIHGISAREARRAPTFAVAAPEIAARLAGRVVVAHNLAFDAPFLAHQFRQLGVDAPLGVETGLCTMTLAATYLPNAGRSLAACCAAASVPLENAHCALDDTRAAALLLRHYIHVAGEPSPWSALQQLSADTQWPTVPIRGVFAPLRRRSLPVMTESFLGRLVETLPRVGTPPEADRYLAVLDRALIDSQISDSEADTLVELARGLGLSRSEVATLHLDYLLALGAGASAERQATGVDITDAEISDLRSVATMLGLPASAADHALRPSDVNVPRQPVRRFALSAGDVVVFTGQVFTGHTPQPREEMERRAVAAGLRVAQSVERDATLLVAADVDTMSVKARTARDYGVPIVSAATFDRFLAAMSDKHRGQFETAPSHPASPHGVDDD